MIEERKQKEAELQNKIRSKEFKENLVNYNYFTSNRKFYSITRKSINFLNDYLLNKYRGKKFWIMDAGTGQVRFF